MFSDEVIDTMADKLLADGYAGTVDPEGNRVAVTFSGNLGFDTREMVLIYENKGALFFDGQRPLNKFRLLSSGFTFLTAPVIVGLVERLTAAVGRRRLKRLSSASTGLVPTAKED
jgi:hypothetical protein